jgi:HEAT repeat protein
MQVNLRDALKLALQIWEDPKTPLALYQALWVYLADGAFSTFTTLLEIVPEKERLVASDLSLHRLSHFPKPLAKFHLMAKFKESLQTPIVPKLQKKVIKILLEINTDESLPILSLGLKSAIADVRREAAWAICCLSQKGMKMPRLLHTAIAREKDTYTKMYLALAIGKARDMRFVDSILELAADSDLFVSIASLLALGKYKMARGSALLKQSLRSDKPFILQYASWATGELEENPGDLLPQLLEISKKYKKATQYYAEMAIRKIK